MNEKNILKSAKHPFIVKLDSIFQTVYLKIFSKTTYFLPWNFVQEVIFLLI